jgi:hypothetical protein
VLVSIVGVKQKRIPEMGILDLNLAPYEPQTPCVWHFVLCCAERRNARGATFARLAGKRAFRLGFARLSAPCSLREPRRRVQSFALSNKKGHQMVSFFRYATLRGEPDAVKLLLYSTTFFVTASGFVLSAQRARQSSSSQLKFKLPLCSTRTKFPYRVEFVNKKLRRNPKDSALFLKIIVIYSYVLFPYHSTLKCKDKF